MIDAPTRAVPEHVVVEISCDDARSLGQKGTVLGECASERTQLMLAAYSPAAVLSPNGKQIVIGRSGDVDRRDMAKRWVKGVGEPRRVAVECENGEPLVAIVTDPNGIAANAAKSAERR